MTRPADDKARLEWWCCVLCWLPLYSALAFEELSAAVRIIAGVAGAVGLLILVGWRIGRVNRVKGRASSRLGDLHAFHDALLREAHSGGPYREKGRRKSARSG